MAHLWQEPQWCREHVSNIRNVVSQYPKLRKLTVRMVHNWNVANDYSVVRMLEGDGEPVSKQIGYALRPFALLRMARWER